MTDEKKDDSTATKPIPQMLFVQSAIKGTFRINTLTFKPYAPALLYFSERPHRLAGHMTVKRYMDIWNQGKDSFKTNPPNAVLSILSDKATTNATIELLEASTLGNAFQYKINIIEGIIPRTFGAASLFIDAFPPAVNDQVTDLTPHHEEHESEEAAPTEVNPMITDAVTGPVEIEPEKTEIEEAATTSVNPQVTDAVTGPEEIEPGKTGIEEAAPTSVNPQVTDAVTGPEEIEPEKTGIEKAIPTPINGQLPQQVTENAVAPETPSPASNRPQININLYAGSPTLTLGSLLYETVGHGLLTTAKNKATEGLATLFGPHSHHKFFTPKDKEEKEKK